MVVVVSVPRYSQHNVVVILLLLLFSSSSVASSSSSKCGIYLAPSSIPGSGLGMFAGHKAYEEGDFVTFPDVVIPIFEMEWNNRFTGEYQFLWDEYTWTAEVFEGMEHEADDVDLITVASPGVGAAANSYLTLVNVEDVDFQMERLLDSENPGAGATSPYFGRAYKATEPIPAGMELYVSYGENYFESRAHTYGYIPMPNSYVHADKILRKFHRMQKRLKSSIPSETSTHVWDGLFTLMKELAPLWETSRVLNALPANASVIIEVLSSGGTGKQHYNSSLRDLDWLEENGQCMDNIKEGISTNPEAGRGAFANRFIPQGGLVGPAPLIHVSDSKLLTVHQTKQNNNGGVDPDIHGPTTKQLLINYCFGHSKSTLLLCPYGLLTSLINHSKEAPNTKIQWSQTLRHEEWLDQPLDEWVDEFHHTGLSIDFVALRDIQEGEEIFIDYGEAWEDAWQTHKSNFVPPRESYIPAFELNKDPDLEFRTIRERPYEKDGIELWCHWQYMKASGVKADDGDSRCRVLKRRDGNRYMVQLVDVSTNDEEELTKVKYGSILWDVPRDALYFDDIPYMRDHYQFWAFRHAMMIPDSIFPEKWRNLE